MIRVEGDDTQALGLELLIEHDQAGFGCVGDRAVVGGEDDGEEFGFLEVFQGQGFVIDADQFEGGRGVADVEFPEARRVLRTGGRGHA